MLFKKTASGPSGDSKNWYKDKYEFIRQQRDVLAAITILCLLLSTAAVFTVMWITPYKSVEPFVIQIDEKSGIVQRVDPVKRTEFTNNEAIDRYFIAQYIRAREGYMATIFRINYQTVRVMSGTSAFRSYSRKVSQSNPNSPLNIFKGTGTRNVSFKNISFVRRRDSSPKSVKVALVRVLLQDVMANGKRTEDTHAVATVEFRYANLKLNEEERYLNPIGFIVENYQIEREVIQ